MPLISDTSICRDDDKCGFVTELVQYISWLHGIIIIEMKVITCAENAVT